VFNLQVTAQDSALDLALAYAEYGISVVPLHRHNKVPPKELGGWQKFQERQPTTEEIEKCRMSSRPAGELSPHT